MKISTKVPYSRLLESAHAAADSARPATLKYFRKVVGVDDKSGGKAFDPVTEADRGAERAIKKVIAARYSDHGFLGEEYGSSSGSSPYRWVVDPIDGTRAFIMGSPMWGTLIGLVDQTGPILGIMDQPFTGERIWSEQATTRMRMADGKTRRVKTRTGIRLSEAILTSTHPNLFETDRHKRALSLLQDRARLTRFGGDCYLYFLLALGFVDLVVEPALKPYDIVALIPIIERAGGKVTTWDGGSPANGGDIVASGNAQLHDEVIKLLKKA